MNPDLDTLVAALYVKMNCFDLDEIVVMELVDSKTVACRKSRHGYERWLDEDYTTGELLQMNLLGGCP